MQLKILKTCLLVVLSSARHIRLGEGDSGPLASTTFEKRLVFRATAFYVIALSQPHIRKMAIWSQISADNIGGWYYRAFLIIFKFEFTYRPIFKRSNIGR